MTVSPDHPPSHRIVERRLDGLLLLGGFMLAAVWLLPSLLGVQIFFPADVLLDQYPWMTFPDAERFADYPSNVLLWDQAFQGYYWARGMAESGLDPFWNPYLRSGMPLLATGQAGVLSPLNLPHYLLPLPASFAWVAILRAGTLWAGCWAFGRAIGLRRPLALLLAVVFFFAPSFLSWLQHSNAGALVFFPWMLYAAERFAAAGEASAEDRRRAIAGAALLLAAVQALHLLSGHFQSSFNMTFGAGVYFLARSAWRPWGPGLVLRAAAAGAVLLGTLMAAAALLPFSEALRGSITFAERAAAAHGAWHLPPHALPLFFQPMLYGTFIQGDPQWSAPSLWTEMQQYIGIVPWALVIGWVVSRRGLGHQKARIAGLAVMGGLGGVLAYGVPGLQDLLVRLPGLAVNNNTRMDLLFQTALIVGALIAAEQLLRTLSEGSPSKQKPLLIVAGAGGFLLLALAAGEWWTARSLVALALAALLAGAFVRGAARPRALVTALALVWMIDVAPVWRGYHYQVPAGFWTRLHETPPGWEPVTEAPLALGAADEATRPNIWGYFGASGLRGYDWPVADRHALYFREGLGLDDDTIPADALADPATARRLLNSGVQFLYTVAGLPHGAATPLITHSPSGLTLYRNENAPAQATFWPEDAVEIVPDLDAALARLPEVLAQENPAPIIEVPGATPRRPSRTAEPIPLETSISPNLLRGLLPEGLDGPGYIVFSKSYDPGWTARFGYHDEDDRPVLAANVKFLAVPVEPDDRPTFLFYEPPSWGSGLRASLAGLFLWALLLIGTRRHLPRARQQNSA